MTTLWEKIKAEIASLEGDFTGFEAQLKSLFESHAAEVADQHIHADEQVSAAVAAAGVLTLDPSPVAEVETEQPDVADTLGTDAPGS